MNTKPIKKSRLLRRVLLKAAKWPLVYFGIGVLFECLYHINTSFVAKDWQTIFLFADPIGKFFITIALLTFLYQGLYLLFYVYEKSLHLNQKIIAILLQSLRNSLKIIFILVGLKITIWIVNPSDFYQNIANGTINALMIAAIGWAFIQVFYTFEKIVYQYHKMQGRRGQKRINTLYTKIRILRNIINVVVGIVTISAILMSFSNVRSIGISLLASAGFLTALIGLSAQKALFTVFSGIQIALSQVIKIGDIIKINNQVGTIEEITFTNVTLKLEDQKKLIVPISYFIENPFENWAE